MLYINEPQALHQAALAAGFTETLPVIPPNAPLHEHSRVDPEARGKVPGEFYSGAWDGAAGWPEFQMSPEAAIRFDSLGANVGQKMGFHWTALDVDVTDPTLAAAMQAYMDNLSGGQWPVRVGEAPKALWLFRVQGDPIKRKQYPFNREGAKRQLQAPEVTQGLNPPEIDTGRPWIEFVADDKGKAYTNKANVHAYMNNSEMWQNCFAYDAFAGRPVVLHPLPYHHDQRVPRFLEDKEYAAAHVWFQRYMWPKISMADVTGAVDISCTDATFEPVQDYLRGLKWDGQSRIDSWLHWYAGVNVGLDPVMIHYTQQIARKWLISAVARAMNPGCQADHSLILESVQGEGKSTLFRTLCPDPEWFSDGLPDFHTKDASEHLQGKWIIEMSEITNVIKSEIEDMRGFLTRRVDQFRPSYGRQQVNRPRRCVFAGSTNRGDYLKDPNGERRLWIARCTKPLMLDALAADRDQLWAEALVAYQAGETWHLDKSTENYARTVQQSRVARDGWKDELVGFLSEQTTVTVLMCLNALGMVPPQGTRDPKKEAMMKAELEHLGWERCGTQRSGPYRNQILYCKTNV